MTTANKTLALALSSAFALTVGAASIHAAENPFSATSLSSGYQVADAGTKTKDGKCGSGKCGAHKKKMKNKMKEGACSAEKMKEGGCSAEKMKEGGCHADKAKEGSCSAEKMKEGACSAEKMKEGSCHAEKK